MELITVDKASKMTNVPEQTIYSWLSDGILTDHKPGKNRVDKREILLKVPTVITSFNQKGGIGKTAFCTLACDYFEKKKMRILLVDLDQQSNLTQCFCDIEKIRYSIFDYLEKNTSLDKIIVSINNYIDLLPASIELAKINNYDSTYALNIKDKMKNFFKNYQIIIIDCPPALNFFSRLGVLLSNYIFMPLVSEPKCYNGLADALDTLETLRKFNPEYLGFKAIINSHKPLRTIIREDYLNMIQNSLKDDLFDIRIPEFIGIVERDISKKNIFDMYNDKHTKKIEELFDKVYKFIYEDR